MDLLKESFQEEHCFSKVALANFGFELCLRSKLLRELYSIKPTGSRSCLYDAIMVGLEHLKGLYQMIEESGKASSWKLINIVICDGNDNCSKNGWEQVKQAYRDAKNRIRAYQFKTIVIAYNVTPQQYSELLYLNELDVAMPIFPASYYHNEYEELNLGKLMKKIRKDVGLLFKQPRQSDLFMMKKDIEEDQVVNNPYDISEMSFSYGVLFTISGSREYDDQIWNSICNNINNFTRYLGDRDILGGIIYSDAVRYFKEEKFILKEEKKKLVSPPPPPPPPPPMPQPILQPILQPQPPQYAYNQFPANNQMGYVPPPYVYNAPPPAPPKPPVYHPPPPPPPPKANVHQKPIKKEKHINKSESSSQKSGNTVSKSQILESKAYSCCNAGGKCRSFCACFLTIFALIIIGGSIFLIIR